MSDKTPSRGHGWRFLSILLLIIVLVSGGLNYKQYTDNTKLIGQNEQLSVSKDSVTTAYTDYATKTEAKFATLFGSVSTLKGYIIDATKSPPQIIHGDSITTERRVYVIKDPNNNVIFVSTTKEEADMCAELIKILPPNSGFQVFDIMNQITKTSLPAINDK